MARSKKEASKIRCVELFSGAGLMGGGFREAGFETTFAAEIDERAVLTYNHNLAPVAEVWDVHHVKKGLNYDVLVAGPPCQGFSSLGKRDPKDVRNKLSLAALKWAKAHRPKVVLVENVPQFLKSEYWLELQEGFSALGYTVTAWVLNAANYGVAQNRNRSFTVFSLIGNPDKPEPCARTLTVKHAFKGLTRKATGLNFHVSPTPTELALSRMRLIPPKGDKRDLLKAAPHLCPPSWHKMGEQAVDVWGRLDWTKPANTLRCDFLNPSKGRYLHPEENRVISLREGARIQGIPDSWGFHGDRTSIARQIGNGVPVPLATAVANSIMELFNPSIV